MSDRNFNDDTSKQELTPGAARKGSTSDSFKPVSRRKEKKTGCFGGLMYFVFIVSVSVIFACLGWMAASDVLALNKEVKTATVTIPEDFTIGEVSTLLKDAGIIQYKALFRFYSGISDAKDKIDPGTYELSTVYDYRAIVKKMQFGSDSQVKTQITFPEGFTMHQLFKRLEENKICRYDKLMECAANEEFAYRFLEGVPLGNANRLEGFLFPDTYEFYQGMTPEAAIDKFLQNFHYKLTAEMWDLATAKGLTMQQVVNIASLIEKEAANNEERANIASVIYNRLSAGINLYIDATSIYSHNDYEGDVTQMIDTWVADSSDPYNTRFNSGLPPTPIANPGLPSIMATLKPNTTKYLFYALDTATKTHKFFNTDAEFNAFTATQNYG